MHTPAYFQVAARRAPKILVCPSGFKESLSPTAAADSIEAGILRAVPDAQVHKAPMVDGGEGFVKSLVAATGGEVVEMNVTGPVGEMVASHYGFLGGREEKTAVIEMAAAAGLSLVPRSRRNPLHTTTYGVGQLLTAALDAGATRVLLGCGDSGTCDGGVGMAQALGARFYTAFGTEIAAATGGAGLGDLASVDLSAVHPRLKSGAVRVDVACNWHNVLCGPSGVARVFGPQKGASSAQVEELEAAMEKVAAVVGGAVGENIALAPGSGASGGLGAGLLLLGARLRPRFEVITEFLSVDAAMRTADLVITAEGGLDGQTPRGKVPAEMARLAGKRGVPVIALAGTVGEGARETYDVGIHAYASILQGPSTLERALEEAGGLLRDAAEGAMRMVMIGWGLADVERGPTTMVSVRVAMDGGSVV